MKPNATVASYARGQCVAITDGGGTIRFSGCVIQNDGSPDRCPATGSPALRPGQRISWEDGGGFVSRVWKIRREDGTEDVVAPPTQTPPSTPSLPSGARDRRSALQQADDAINDPGPPDYDKRDE
jgi:hypothetical protein